ncbi:3-deoxy-manno-octulosonate cytidylyltransferase [Pelomonas sp. CA6]|uniref:3-deoxy-manno-octulosonate cytidylyltransferase n=1 Tax=Pelomonas sp. CA6 TaxID=2907999 RepID=UPI001F4C1288|nr:3-deoxy-manno-octulosonate cytidylyltransferase [Pelomonas sp. CA6]MCH7345747.1 3-deoxy-manno-octulosonate cytidylyltransferase [Pelomonas sp. CA6]
MGFVVIVPARLASTRLPGKPLADIHGLPMIVRVARQAALSGAERVVVATDATEVREACLAHGVEALMTRADHASGSDRLAEACTQLGLADEQCVINVQGDEPLIAPTMIQACAALLTSRPDCVMSTVAHAITDAAEFANPNVVKLVCDREGRALYFSRAPIPWWRDAPAAGAHPYPEHPDAVLRHVGLYGYRAGFLRRFPQLSQSPLEQIEALEQLRVLWHGERIAVHVSAERPGPGVDTPQDLERVRQLLAG